MDYLVQVTIEPKEDETSEGVQPGLPDLTDLASYLESCLADQTRHEAALGWRVISVTC